MTIPLTPVTIIPRKSVNRNEYLILISSKLFQHFLLDKDREYKISLGKKLIKINIHVFESNSNEISFPEILYKEICLPIQPYNFYARYMADRCTLYLGPIIGLLTDFHANESAEPHFRSVNSFSEELHHGITEHGGFFYVFSFRDFSNQGFYFENGKWHSFVPPLPDVIYNRIHSRKLEFSHEFKLFRNELEQLNIPFFNDRFLSKWEVHEHLINENHLHPHIPETALFSKENLIEFAKKYDTVFIKPVHGSQGRNIFKLIKENHLYSLKTSLKNKSKLLSDQLIIEEIYQQLKPLLNNRIYILQQGIPLITIESRGIDFRVLCHKNHRNMWEVTSVVARVSAEDEFVSNIARGGEIMTPLSALGEVMSRSEAKTVLTQMKELSIETAASISSQASGITGELGIDIGIDQEGKPWLIEVNSKPSKNFDDGLIKIRPSAKAIIHFCNKLAFDTLEEMEE